MGICYILEKFLEVDLDSSLAMWVSLCSVISHSVFSLSFLSILSVGSSLSLFLIFLPPYQLHFFFLFFLSVLINFLLVSAEKSPFYLVS